MASASVQALRVVDATAKQELLEALLGADDVAGCVERSLAWLAEHAGVSHAICALGDVERGELIGVARPPRHAGSNRKGDRRAWRHGGAVDSSA